MLKQFAALFFISSFFLFAKQKKTFENENGKDTLSIVFEKKLNTAYLSIPNVSAVIGDNTDPAAVFGFNFSILKNNTAIGENDYSINISVNNPIVIDNDGITIKKDKGIANIKLLPRAEGYCTITIKFASGKLNDEVIINYAVSPAFKNSNNIFWATGICDASAAIALNNNEVIIADDEQNKLFVYNKTQSGLSLASFDYSKLITFKDCNGGTCSETDIEAATQSPSIKSKVYWLGSMSNGKQPSCKLKPNRDIIFVTDINSNGSNTEFKLAGYYQHLRESIIKWGNKYGYKFSRSAADGADPKEKDGFNIEGVAFAPDKKTLYIALRAPLVPVQKRNNALIIPLLDFENWFNKGNHVSEPQFGEPIELSLGERGIRDVVVLSNGVYIIAAGGCDNTANTVLYKWDGKSSGKTVLLPFNCEGLNIEGITETVEGGKMCLNKLYVVCDDGRQILYNDAVEAKQLGIPEFKKFKAAVLTAEGEPLAPY